MERNRFCPHAIIHIYRNREDTAMLNFEEMIMLNVSLYAFSMLVTLFLLIGTVTDNERKKPFIISFTFLLISNIFMQLGEAGIWLFEGSPDNVILLYLSAQTSLVFNYVLVISYIHCLTSFIKEKTSVSPVPTRVVMGICAIFILLLFIALPNGWFFSFDEEGYIVYGSLYGLVRLSDAFFVIVEMLSVLKFRKVLTLRGTLILISFSVLPLTLAITMQFWWYPTPEYLSITLSLIMIYILFHGETTRQLAEKKLQLAQQETQLTESRISIMLSQIQPHFMYNMLTTIMYLCRTNPEEAEKTVGQFSRYLRANMDSLTLKQCIPFENEMNHVKTYLSLEKKRFGDKLRVELDIKEKDFMLPALTIQPIIENAVKYGMKKKKELVIQLKTYSDDNNYYIEILDNGRGFDENEAKNDGKSHIGIENVRNRLKMMRDGVLTIDSAIERGTKVVIKLQKTNKKSHDAK